MLDGHVPGAKFSPDRKYRYLLTRRLGFGDGAVMFLMLNPSTADVPISGRLGVTVGSTSAICHRFAPLNRNTSLQLGLSPVKYGGRTSPPF